MPWQGVAGGSWSHLGLISEVRGGAEEDDRRGVPRLAAAVADPAVHYDCPDPATAAAQSNPGEPCTLVVGEWRPAEYTLRHEPVIEPVEAQAK